MKSKTKKPKTIFIAAIASTLPGISMAVQSELNTNEFTYQAEESLNILNIQLTENNELLSRISLNKSNTQRLLTTNNSYKSISTICSSIPESESKYISYDGSLILTTTLNDYGTEKNKITVYDRMSCNKILEKKSKYARTTYDGRKDLGLFIWSEDTRTDSPFDKNSSTVYITNFKGKSFVKDRGYRFLRDYLFINKDYLYSSNSHGENILINVKTWKKHSDSDKIERFETKDNFDANIKFSFEEKTAELIEKWKNNFTKNNSGMGSAYHYATGYNAKDNILCAAIAGVSPKNTLNALLVCAPYKTPK
ncbi:hypothetical protein [Uliginosibacterium sp. TH139]|uniref:hypothetical protein n=1 Tax=Uliginosibacterium sp. TH139 TaxID=2067453 RepID=UPI00117EF42E|nr:hypothetical protein [Uliginosibacterium sp. TH139]